MYIVAALLCAFFLSVYEITKKKGLEKSSVYETLFFYCFGRIEKCNYLIF